MSFIDTVDLGRFLAGGPAERAEEAARFDRAGRDTGFVLLKNHSVPDGLLTQAFAQARRYFALPTEKKAELAPETDEHFNGYFGKGTESSGTIFSTRNLVQYREKFMISRPVESTAWRPDSPDVGWPYQPNRWPELDGFREVYLAFYAAMEAVSFDTMRVAATALGLPETWFFDKLDQHESTASWMHYPPQIVPPTGDEMRCPPHSDVGSLTFLVQDEGLDGRHPGGLQVLCRDNVWRDVESVPGTILMNVGETMRRWTNDRWTSSKHRVVNPPPDQAHTSRISLGFFQKPNFWTRLDPIPGTSDETNPPRYNDMLIGQYMRYRMLHSVGHRTYESFVVDEKTAAVREVALT